MKPILFNTEMVRAILEGRKTVTRRVIKWPEDSNVTPLDFGCALKPPYQVNDVLYVRETYAVGSIEYGEESFERELQPYISQCIGENDIIYKEFALNNNIGTDDVKWRPSIFMPKEAARIFLRVKSVRVERLHDMELEDFIAEGASGVDELNYRFNFSVLWDSTIKKDQYGSCSWSANPYVWVIEFERISKEEADNE